MSDDFSAARRSAAPRRAPPRVTSQHNATSDAPIAGFYKCRLVRNGPFVAIRLAVHGERDDEGNLIEDEQMRCWVNGLEVPLSRAPWPYCGRHPITEAEYAFLLADAAHAAEHRPRDPKATPRKPVDWYGIRGT